MSGRTNPLPPERRAALLERLRAALEATRFAGVGLEAMADRGLAHDHVRLVGRGVVARIPKQSQMDLEAAANLVYQAACFERAAASGHAPRLVDRIEPGAALPRGALLVEEIRGRPARLPQDLPAIADALAAIHSLPLPGRAARPPLVDAPDPLAALAAEIEAQAMHLDDAALAPASRARIDAVCARWAALVAQPARPPRRLIAFDAHPGNFLVEPGGRAVLVDLEKARYSFPPLDLAHATLYTSTTWDLESRAELTPDEVVATCRRWLARIGEAPRWTPWLVPLRAAMWLWSVTWCAKWRVLSTHAVGQSADGEDWSAARSDAALVAHVRDRVDCYLSPEGVCKVTAELDRLGAVFGALG